MRGSILTTAARPAPGLILAAPASGCGKTVTALALLRALRRTGIAVAPAKAGPDYIDPAFHTAASGRTCLNLDAWAMRPETLAGLAAALGRGADLVLCEGVMGLFDGAADGTGSTADLAARLGWPVVLVVDCAGQAASAAAVLRGFATHRAEVAVAGVIFNRVGGAGHERTLRDSVSATMPEVAVLGCLPRDPRLALRSRHLGLVQAAEHSGLDAFLDAAADLAAARIDLAALRSLARPARIAAAPPALPLPRLGQRVAVAHDAAFAFAYPAVIEGWRAAGADILPFSPLADAAPDAAADAVYLPGGYPELHAGKLAANRRFLEGLRAAAARRAAVYGECGGYMVLGRGLVDAAGERHEMAGLLPLETSFAAPRLHLGYRSAATLTASPLGPAGTGFAGHEFHYASIVTEGPGQALFRARDARHEVQAEIGLAAGTVAGSFLHLIDRGASAGAEQGR